MHLRAYRAARYQVVAFADPVLEHAEKARDEFYPHAEVFDSAESLLARDDINIVDCSVPNNQHEKVIVAAADSVRFALRDGDAPLHAPARGSQPRAGRG